MIVVSDTSVILNLCFLGQKALLDRLQADARFWISPSLRRAVLLAAGEAS